MAGGFLYKPGFKPIYRAFSGVSSHGCAEKKNLTVAARPGRWDLAAIFELFPRIAERRGIELVELVRQEGVANGLFGAKITGGGAGGTVGQQAHR